MATTEARQSLTDAKQTFRLLRDERAVIERWEQLVVDHDVQGKNAHDARLVAATLRHGMTKILTFNGQDFARFSEISVVAPDRTGSLEVAE